MLLLPDGARGKRKSQWKSESPLRTDGGAGRGEDDSARAGSLNEHDAPVGHLHGLLGHLSCRAARGHTHGATVTPDTPAAGRDQAALINAISTIDRISRVPDARPSL